MIVGGTYAPPVEPGPTAMWMYGGDLNTAQHVSTVQRFTFATDTGSARASLTVSRSKPGTTGNDIYGWVGGGEAGSNSPTSFVERITYVSDTSATSTRGPLSLSLRHLSATGNSNFGWYGAGSTPSGEVSSLSRITYASDTNTGTTRGPLIAARYFYFTGTDKTNFGYWNDGVQGTGLQRVTFSNDTATASVVTFFPTRVYPKAFAGTTVDGYFGSGNNINNEMVSTIFRLTFSTSTLVARSNMIGMHQNSGGGNDTFGYYAGGTNPALSNPQTVVQRITYSTDTISAVQRGLLSIGQSRAGSTSGYQ